ncbi:MAG: hypothetical protein IPP34_09190 [Bacteroidetes bacterium]|nr:hypothetical protein [Bacteroidota bacterium]
MKKLYTMLLMILPFGMFAQTEHQHHDKCLTDHYYRQYIKENPEYLKQEQQLEIETHKFVNQYIASKARERKQECRSCQSNSCSVSRYT